MNAAYDRRLFTTAAVLALALTACGGGEAEQVSEGQVLFEAHCVDCHGERALGDGPMAERLPIAPPSLLEHLGHHPIKQLIQLIRSGVPPAMPPAALTDDQVRLVIDYAWTLVPDSIVAGLRDMQRQAEMGMPMDKMQMEGMPMQPDSAGDMSGMDHSEHMMAPNTSGH